MWQRSKKRREPDRRNGRLHLLKEAIFPRPWGGLAIFLLLLGPVLAFVAYRFADQAERQRTQMAFADYVESEGARLSMRLLTLTESLHAMRGLFDASEQVTREEFARFTAQMQARHAVIRALEWVPRVGASDLDAFVRSVREDGQADFRIAPARDPASAVDAHAPHAYYPVTYIQPMSGNEGAFGYDLASDPNRWAALQRAIRTGDVTFTEPVSLVQASGEAGFLGLLPVYPDRRTGGARDDADVEGLVCIVFLGPDLLRNLSPTPGTDERFLIGTLRDAGVPGERGVIGRWTAGGEAPASGYEPHQVDWTIGGRRWVLEAQPSGRFLASRGTNRSLLLGLLALLAWELFAGALVTVLRTRHDLALRRQSDLMQSVLQNLEEAVLVADSSGSVRLANPAAERLLGVPGVVDPPSGWATLHEFFAEDGKTPCEGPEMPIRRALRGERLSGELVLQRRSHESEGRWLAVEGAPLLNEEGTQDGGVAVIRDVTARRRREEEVRQLATAVEQTADAVVITDRSGLIRYVNPAFEKVSGFSASEALGRAPLLLRADPDHRSTYRELWKTVQAGKPFQGTTVNRRRNGETFYAEQTVTPVRGASGEIESFIAVLRDVTEQMRMREREIEMRLAGDVQQRLYPERAPHVPGFELAGRVVPAEVTCGDYYDFIPLPNGQMLLAVGDVCGHGLGPAILMAQTRAHLRSFAATGMDLLEILERTNGLLAGDIAESLFVTLTLVAMDPGSRSLSYANAGHTSGVLLDAKGDVRLELEPTGPALGIFPQATYGERAGEELMPGDVLVLLTDGVIESRSPEGTYFGAERVLEILRSANGASAAEVIDRVHVGVQTFVGEGPQLDDLTLVVCRVEAKGPEGTA